jgi:hypothetical protein
MPEEYALRDGRDSRATGVDLDEDTEGIRSARASLPI